MTEGKNTILLQKRQEEWETAENNRVCSGILTDSKEGYILLPLPFSAST